MTSFSADKIELCWSARSASKISQRSQRGGEAEAVAGAEAGAEAKVGCPATDFSVRWLVERCDPSSGPR